jgi:hypothetical protein
MERDDDSKKSHHALASKAVARARSATGGLTRIFGHHELRLCGPARRTNGGTAVRQGLISFGRFRNTQSSPSAPASRDSGPTDRSASNFCLPLCRASGKSSRSSHETAAAIDQKAQPAAPGRSRKTAQALTSAERRCVQGAALGGTSSFCQVLLSAKGGERYENLFDCGSFRHRSQHWPR